MDETLNSLSKLIKITDTLMGEDGCPWDKVQTRESLKPYLVEETYEVLEALDENDPEKIKDELGDLLYQIIFHSKISSLKGEFDFRDVIDNHQLLSTSSSSAISATAATNCSIIYSKGTNLYKRLVYVN